MFISHPMCFPVDSGSYLYPPHLAAGLCIRESSSDIIKYFFIERTKETNYAVNTNITPNYLPGVPVIHDIPDVPDQLIYVVTKHLVYLVYLVYLVHLVP